jgi:drug/metabolite transporter (DMT)-like permease
VDFSRDYLYFRHTDAICICVAFLCFKEGEGNMKTWHYALIVFLGGASYGILSTVVKLAYTKGFMMPQVTVSQLLMGTIILWLAVLFTKKQKVTLAQTVKMLVAGIPVGLTGVFYYQSLQTLDASLAIVFLFQFVWIGTLLEWLIGSKKPTVGKLVSIAILIIGTVLSAGIISDGGMMKLPGIGIMWGVLSAVTFSAFLYISSSVGTELPPVQKSAMLSTGGLFTVLVLFPPTFMLDIDSLAGIAPYGLFLGVFGVVLPPVLFAIGMPRVGVGLGTILAASELPVAVIVSALVLAENVAMIQWIGVAIILGGIVLGNSNISLERWLPTMQKASLKR